MLSYRPHMGKETEMKLTRVLLSASLVVGLSSAGVAQVSGMANGPHDLRNKLGITTNQICIVCHAPHDATTAKVAGWGDLWNHEVTAQTFTLFGGQTGVAVGKTAADIDPLTGLCLSCHDGTVGAGDFKNGAGQSSTPMNTHLIPGGGWRTTWDLGGTHPVSMEMNQTRYDAAKTGGFSDHWMGGTKNAKLRGGGSAHSIECYTCHNPHGTSTNSYGGALLRFPIAGSELCVRCHDNK